MEALRVAAVPRRAADRCGEVVHLRIGDRASPSCSRMKRFSMARALRPVKPRVSAVGARRFRASRCAGDVAASGVSMNAVPSWAAAAPAASTAATPRPVTSPPVATRGSSLAARTSWSRASSPASATAVGSCEPRWPPASTPCTTRASAPASAAANASSALVTVIQASQPASRSEPTTAASGQPNVKETTGTRSERKSSSLAFQPSSSW